MTCCCRDDQHQIAQRHTNSVQQNQAAHTLSERHPPPAGRRAATHPVVRIGGQPQREPLCSAADLSLHRLRAASEYQL
ncbi:hypothetical protein EYF80_042035 [Liparis tanakae]|uniref:Uncharacterized protein n=1 Tax=Liparis tanakae TaxID=230148 RepID=A0A4Z2G5B8_9TELE|nr:hypothetical protein EYF80_042035 [Liparis tanakae]